MIQIIFGGLLSTPAPTAPIVGIAFIVLFAIVGVMVGPDYDGMNAPSLGKSKNGDQDWLPIDLASKFSYQASQRFNENFWLVFLSNYYLKS